MRVQGGVMEKLQQTSLAELVAFAGGPVVSPPPVVRTPLATSAIEHTAVPLAP
jgi:hypothetical protein